MVNVDYALQVHHQLLMAHLVFVLKMIRFTILKLIFVKIDALKIRSGQLINVHVYHNTVGGIKFAKNVLIAR